MRPLILAATAMLPFAAAAQSVIYEFGPRDVPYEVAYTGYVPRTTFTGVAIVRSQRDMDKLWTNLQGSPGLANAVSPLRLNGPKEQFIVVVVPPDFGFDAQPTVLRLTAHGRSKWAMDVVPQQGTLFRGLGGTAQVVVVRTQTGPDDLDVAFYGPEGDVFARLRTREPKPKGTAGDGVELNLYGRKTPLDRVF